MSRTWQWILGILAGIVVIGLIVGAVFMWQNHMAWWGPGGFAASGGDPQQGPVGPYGYEGYRRYHMDNWGWGMPMHGGGYPGSYGYTPFGTGFMIVAGLLRLLLPLGLLALVAYVFYQMGKRAGGASATAAPVAPRPDVRPLPSRKVARR